MTTAAEDPRAAIYRHLRDHADLLLSEGVRQHVSRVEIQDFSTVVMMPPQPLHDLNAGRAARQLRPQLAEDMTAELAGDVGSEEAGTLRRPDVVVAPETAYLSGAIDPHEIVLVMEVVSPSNPDNDYVSKTRDYPRMGIEHYLILDPRAGSWLYQWGIRADAAGVPEYANRLVGSFGETVTVGDGWKLDTSVLVKYPE